MTVNRALTELAKEGVIDRVPGVGSFVSESKHKSAVLQVRDIAEEVAESGRHHHCTCLRLVRSRSQVFNRLLGLAQGTFHYRSTLLHHADGMPIQLEDRYVNPSFAPDYLEQDFAQITPYQHLIAQGPVQAAEHVFKAARPSPEQAQWLGVSVDCACIVLRRRTWSRNIVAGFAILMSPGDRQRYSGGFGTMPPLAKTLPPL